jgi:hypothetical protein
VPNLWTLNTGLEGVMRVIDHPSTTVYCVIYFVANVKSLPWGPDRAFVCSCHNYTSVSVFWPRKFATPDDNAVITVFQMAEYLAKYRGIDREELIAE